MNRNCNNKLVSLFYREVGTQTSNTFQSAIEVLKQAIKQPQFIQQSTYTEVNKHIRTRTQPQQIKPAVYNTSRKGQTLLAEPNVRIQCQNEIINSAGKILPLRVPTIRLHMFSEFHCSRFKTQFFPSPFPFLLFKPQLKSTYLNQAYHKVNYAHMHLAENITTQSPQLSERLTKNELRSRVNKVYCEHVATKTCSNFNPFQSPNITLPVASNSNNTNRHFLPLSGIRYLELHTQDLRKNRSKVLPILLPSPIIATSTTLKHINPIRGNPEITISSFNDDQTHLKISNSVSYSCNVEKILTYLDQSGCKMLKSCQISLIGYDGKTRNTQVNFL